MIFIDKQSYDPWFNLAAEEFVLKNLSEDVFMLWQNTESIVFGKHQLPQHEFDLQLAENENVPVIRRISGGGTVYHGPGNVNFSFITTESTDKINFQKFLLPIQMYLKSLGIQAEITSKSNLTINELKISGNAASVHRNRSLHHGTLLFESDRKRLDHLLASPKKTYLTKAVMSKRVNTTNIVEHLKQTMGFEEFCNGLKNSVNQYFGISEDRSFTVTETEEILKLTHEKYKTWNWNFGYSPEYRIDRTISLFGKEENISLHIKQGCIDSVITSDEHANEYVGLLSEMLSEIPHTRSVIIHKLNAVQNQLTLDRFEFNNLINNIL